MNKRKNVWNRLQGEMKNKRTRPDPRGKGKNKKSGSAPHELIVQRLASEPDNKQTFRPVQPRDFVTFSYEDLTLANLKKACADHYSLPASSCDVLVTNKGPSCTSIEQIPHRKDKVGSCNNDAFACVRATPFNIPHPLWMRFSELYSHLDNI